MHNKRLPSAAKYLNAHKQSLSQDSLDRLLNLYLSEDPNMKFTKYLVESVGARPNEETIICLSSEGSIQLVEYFKYDKTNPQELLESAIIAGNKKLSQWLIDKGTEVKKESILDCFPNQSDRDTIELYGLAISKGIMEP
jgi:hypothetical protein